MFYFTKMYTSVIKMHTGDCALNFKQILAEISSSTSQKN